MAPDEIAAIAAMADPNEAGVSGKTMPCTARAGPSADFPADPAGSFQTVPLADTLTLSLSRVRERGPLGRGRAAGPPRRLHVVLRAVVGALHHDRLPLLGGRGAAGPPARRGAERAAPSGPVALREAAERVRPVARPVVQGAVPERPTPLVPRLPVAPPAP